MQWLKDTNAAFDTLKGGLGNAESLFLKDLVSKVIRPGMIGFDTGCYTGWTASQVWDVFNANGGHFYCVDWFKGNVNSQVGDYVWDAMATAEQQSYLAAADKILLQLLKNIEVSAASDFVSVVITDSWRPAFLLADKSIDYVYVGGDHRYSGIKRDLEAWVPKVRSGGVICGHAYLGYVEPNSDKWKQLCAEPELDYYHHAGCHFGVNRALHELFGSSICVGGSCWGKFL